jgi:hypothetical protein
MIRHACCKKTPKALYPALGRAVKKMRAGGPEDKLAAAWKVRRLCERAKEAFDARGYPDNWIRWAQADIDATTIISCSRLR